MKYISLIIVFSVFMLLVYVGLNFDKATKNPLQISKDDIVSINTPPTPTPTLTPTPTPSFFSHFETVAGGLSRPHGIGVYKGITYISSESEKILYKNQDGRTERFVEKVDFPHDMLFDEYGTITTPLFRQNKVVTIDQDGTITPLIEQKLSGPNGITKDQNGNLYITNYFSNSVVKYDPKTKEITTVVDKLGNPAGIFYNRANNSLYIANYSTSTITIFNLDNNSSKQIPVSDLDWIESIYVTQDQKILITAILNTYGIVAEVSENGTYQVLLQTDFTNPLVGYFTQDGYVYLTSSNDLRGRVLRAKY